MITAAVALISLILTGQQSPTPPAKQDFPTATPVIQKEIDAANRLADDQAYPALVRILGEARTAKDQIGTFMALVSICQIQSHRGNVSAALERIQEANKVGDTIHSAPITILGYLLSGRLEVAMERFVPARDDLTIAIIAARKLGEKDILAASLGVLGFADFQLGKTTEAINLLTEAQSLGHIFLDPFIDATIGNNLGLCLLQVGQLSKAQALFEAAIAEAKMDGNPVFEASATSNLGFCRYYQGNFSEAMSLFSDAAKLEAAHPDPAVRCEILDNQAVLHMALGDITGGEAILMKLRDTAKSYHLLGIEATAINNLALCYRADRKPAAAESAYREALMLDQQLGATVLESVIYESLGALAGDRHAYPEARHLLSQALALEESAHVPAMVGVTHISLANLDLLQGQSELARTTALQALSEARKASSQALEANALLTLAEVLDAQAKSRAQKRRSDTASDGAAILAGKLAVNLVQGIRQNAVGVGPDLQRTLTQSLTPMYREVARLLLKQGRLLEAEQVMNLLKDEEYFQLLDLRAAKTATQVDLTLLEQKWASKYTALFAGFGELSQEYDHLSQIPAPALTQGQKARLAAIDRRFEACNAALSAYFASARAAFNKVNAAEARLDDLEAATELSSTLKQLPGHPAAIYTLLSKDGVHLVLNLPNGAVLREPAHNLSEALLRDKIFAFRAALKDPRTDPRPLGAELYELLIRPLENDLKTSGTKTLMWSLDSRLRFLPLWALYDARKNQYLIEKYPSSLFTPRSIDKQLKAVHPREWNGAEFGVSEPRTVGPLPFEPLPNVPEELVSVAHSVGGKPLLDTNFTRSALDDAFRNHPKVLHLATHFNFVPGNEKASFLLVGDGELTVDQFKNLRSGILNGIELLTLSACDTAAGDIRSSSADGGEFESFALLAQLKGADAVLASLWNVDDKSTSMLMGEFYRLRTSHPEWTKLQALQQAQIEMMRGKLGPPDSKPPATKLIGRGKESTAWTGTGFTHPFYWAPFEIIGNWQ